VVSVHCNGGTSPPPPHKIECTEVHGARLKEMADVGPPVQEGCGELGVGPKAHEDYQRPGTPVLQRKVEGFGLVQPGECSRETLLWPSST